MHSQLASHVRRLPLALALPVLLLSAGQACAQGGAQDRAAQFARLDVNEDGWLSGTELRACDCAALDANRDGRVARAEYERGAPTAAARATGAPAAARGAAATAAAAHTPWAAMGTHAAGERVRYRAAGNLWYDGVVQQVGPDPSMPAITATQYLIEGQGWYDYQNVAGTEREPYWTGYFLGDWEVSVPVAMNTKVIGTDVYRVVSGGMRLPPLRVNADGTYQWRVLDGRGGERLIQGRWAPRPDAPGIVLLQGDQGADWSVYSNTDESARTTFGRAQIYITADCCTAQTAQRVPTAAPGTLRPGDRVFERRENGSYRLGTVSEVGRGRVRLDFKYLGSEWVATEKLRRAEW